MRYLKCSRDTHTTQPDGTCKDKLFVVMDLSKLFHRKIYTNYALFLKRLLWFFDSQSRILCPYHLILTSREGFFYFFLLLFFLIYTSNHTLWYGNKYATRQKTHHHEPQKGSRKPRQDHRDGRKWHLLCRYRSSDQCIDVTHEVRQPRAHAGSPPVLWTRATLVSRYSCGRCFYRWAPADLGCRHSKIIIFH